LQHFLIILIENFVKTFLIILIPYKKYIYC
jgi:hypothetical protein